MIDNVYLGDRVRSTWGPILDTSTGEAVAPPLVLFLVRKPGGAEVMSIYGEPSQPYLITRDGSGAYYADVPIVVIEEQGNRSIKWGFKWLAFDELGDPLKSTEQLVPIHKSLFATPLPTIP